MRKFLNLSSGKEKREMQFSREKALSEMTCKGLQVLETQIESQRN